MPRGFSDWKEEEQNIDASNGDREAMRKVLSRSDVDSFTKDRIMKHISEDEAEQLRREGLGRYGRD